MSFDFVIAGLIFATLVVNFLPELLDALVKISVLIIEILASSLMLLRRLLDPPGKNTAAFKQVSDTIAPRQTIAVRTELVEARCELPATFRGDSAG